MSLRWPVVVRWLRSKDFVADGTSSNGLEKLEKLQSNQVMCRAGRKTPEF